MINFTGFAIVSGNVLIIIRSVFLGSMLPQYMALSVSFVSSVCQKKNLGRFEAR